MLRAILFDFNGILVDDEPIHFELFQRVLEEEGLGLTAEDYWAKYLGFDDRECFKAVFEAAGQSIDPTLLARLIARKSAYYQALIARKGFPFFPGAAELIAAAVDSDLVLGVVSGALRAEVEGALDQLGVREHFKTVVGAEDVSASKPDPEGYRRGLENLNSLPPLPPRLFHPHEVLAIEDSPAGLASAAGAGLATLGVAQTYPAETLEGADHVIPALASVTLNEIRVLYGE